MPCATGCACACRWRASNRFWNGSNVRCPSRVLEVNTLPEQAPGASWIHRNRRGNRWSRSGREPHRRDRAARDAQAPRQPDQVRYRARERGCPARACAQSRSARRSGFQRRSRSPSPCNGCPVLVPGSRRSLPRFLDRTCQDAFFRKKGGDGRDCPRPTAPIWSSPWTLTFFRGVVNRWFRRWLVPSQ